MKVRCKREMKKHYQSDDMRMTWRIEGSKSNRKNFKKRMDRHFKKKWKNEADRQFIQELTESI